MGIGEYHASRCKSIHVGCGYFASGIEAGNIPVSHVVGDYVNDVRKGFDAASATGGKSTQG
jgi:hypothetical protein